MTEHFLVNFNILISLKSLNSKLSSCFLLLLFFPDPKICNYPTQFFNLQKYFSSPPLHPSLPHLILMFVLLLTLTLEPTNSLFSQHWAGPERGMDPKQMNIVSYLCPEINGIIAINLEDLPESKSDRLLARTMLVWGGILKLLQPKTLEAQHCWGSWRAS